MGACNARPSLAGSEAVTSSRSRIAPQQAAQEFSVSIAAGTPDTCLAIGQHTSWSFLSFVTRIWATTSDCSHQRRPGQARRQRESQQVQLPWTKQKRPFSKEIKALLLHLLLSLLLGLPSPFSWTAIEISGHEHSTRVSFFLPENLPS